MISQKRYLNHRRHCLLCATASFLAFTHPLHALVLVAGRLLDAVDVVLKCGVTPGVVLLLLVK